MESPTGIPVLRNLIGGTWSESAGEDVVEVVNPATEELLATFRSATDSDVDRAVRAARAAAPQWAALTPGERSALLQEVTDRIQAELDQLCDLEVANTGKPISAARADEFPLACHSQWPP